MSGDESSSAASRERFLRTYKSERVAWNAMVDLNLAYAAAGNKRDVACFIEGPDDDVVVCDIASAIETGLPYQWSSSRVRPG